MSTSIPYASVLLAGVLLRITSCSSTTTTGTSKQTDDASTSTGGTAPSTTGSGGTSGAGGTAGSTDGSVTDASSKGVTVSCPSSPSVSHVVETALPQTPVPPGSGGTHSGSIRDAGSDAPLRLPGLSTDPCVTYASPPRPGGPRSIFGCPTVHGPNGGTTIHPGDQITVTVPLSDEGLSAYSCFGIDSSNALIGGYYLTYAVQPAYAEATGQVSPDTKPGTVFHFTAEASGSRYTSAPGAACSNDLTRIDFDVTVGG